MTIQQLQNVKHQVDVQELFAWDAETEVGVFNPYRSVCFIRVHNVDATLNSALEPQSHKKSWDKLKSWCHLTELMDALLIVNQ